MTSILITGASSGIGAATARAAALSGRYDRIFITGWRNPDKLKEVRDEANTIAQGRMALERSSSGSEEICTMSVGDIGDINYVEELHTLTGPVDVIINNASIAHYGLLIDLTPDEWSRIVSTNLTSVYNVCHTYLRDMISKKQGKIINISSVWGEAGASCEVAYSACKGAVNTFTKALAREMAPSNIQINAVSFGMVDTAMNAHLSEEELSELIDEIPAGRVMMSDEAAEAILKVVELPDYMTGQIITFDGGWR